MTKGRRKMEDCSLISCCQIINLLPARNLQSISATIVTVATVCRRMTEGEKGLEGIFGLNQGLAENLKFISRSRNVAIVRASVASHRDLPSSDRIGGSPRASELVGCRVEDTNKSRRRRTPR
jgi:hypothetical protein